MLCVTSIERIVVKISAPSRTGRPTLMNASSPMNAIVADRERRPRVAVTAAADHDAGAAPEPGADPGTAA